jgi:hypothetical protein
MSITPPLFAIKIATLNDVREYTDNDPVELWLNDKGRIVIRAYNECQYNYTDVDLIDLLCWAKSGFTDTKTEGSS